MSALKMGIACLTGIASVLYTCVAAGQTATSNESAGQLGEIVVTAQKRAENIRDVPLNISAVSGTELVSRDINQFEDLGRAVPGLSVVQGGAPGFSNISMRGVSSSTSDGTVGVFLDDVSVTSRNTYASGAAEPRFLDIEQVEVLRGPQGTLYGASSMGGALRFITTPPNPNEYEGSVRAQATTTNDGGPGYEVTAIQNIPLSAGRDALRVAVTNFQTDGYLDRVSPTNNATLKHNANTDDGWAARIAVLSQVGDDLTVTPSVFFQRTEINDLSLINPYLPNFEKNTQLDEAGTDELVVSSLALNYDLGHASLTSVTSYLSRDFNQLLDGAALNSQYFGYYVLPSLGLNGAPVAALASPVMLSSTVGQFTQEIRLASNGDRKAPGAFSWVTGLYFNENRYHLRDYETIPGLTQTFLSNYGVTPATLLGAPFPNDAVYLSDSKIDERQSAAFGDFTYQATSSVRITLGGRFSEADVSLQRSGNYYFAGGPSQNSSDDREHAFTPRLAVTYEISPDATAYANVGEGFRLGTPNRAIPVSLCEGSLAAIGLTEAPSSSRSDSLWNYEAGIKTAMLNNLMTFDVTAYYIVWHNIQQDIVLPDCGFDFNANAGNARSYGTEFEWALRPTPKWELKLSGSSTDAYITNDIGSLGVVKGDKVLGVPEWSGATSVDYRSPIGDEWTLKLGTAYQYIGPSYGAFTRTNPNYHDPSYGVLGATAGFESRGGLELSLFVANALNAVKVIQQPNVVDLPRGVIVQPRTIGVSAAYRY